MNDDVLNDAPALAGQALREVLDSVYQSGAEANPGTRVEILRMDGTEADVIALHGVTQDGHRTVTLHEITGATPKEVQRRQEVSTPAGFLRYVAMWPEVLGRFRHLFTASPDHATVTAELDAPPNQERPTRGQHSVTLALRHTPEWQALSSANGKRISQLAFAEWVETWAHVFQKPDAATLATMALNLRGASNVKWASAINRTSGGIQLKYEESASAAGAGVVQFPETGLVQVAVFEGTDSVVSVPVRFSYRVTSEGLFLGLEFVGAEKIRRAAFDAVLNQVADGLGIPAEQIIV